jgi:hypothetical protein
MTIETRYISARADDGKTAQLEVSTKGNILLPGRYLVKIDPGAEWQWAELVRAREGWRYEILPPVPARRDRLGEAAAVVMGAALALPALGLVYGFMLWLGQRMTQ